MPVIQGYKQGWGFYQWGDHGAMYWYQPGDKAQRKRAKEKAARQGRAIAARRNSIRAGKVETRVKRTKNKRWSNKYVPRSLSAKDKQKHIEHMLSGKISPRPKVKNYPKKQSRWKTAFEAKYGKRSFKWITKHLISEEGANKILNKGYGAYVTSGSRPNQTAGSWAYARLYSVLMGGPARDVDYSIWDKYKLV